MSMEVRIYTSFSNSSDGCCSVRNLVPLLLLILYARDCQEATYIYICMCNVIFSRKFFVCLHGCIFLNVVYGQISSRARRTNITLGSVSKFHFFFGIHEISKFSIFPNIFFFLFTTIVAATLLQDLTTLVGS